MSNLMKLSALASLCFSLIVFGACGGGEGGGGGKYNPIGGSGGPCSKYRAEGGADATGSAYTNCLATSTGTTSGTGTNVSVSYTVTNGTTYVRTGTETGWHIYTGTSTSSN